jgi:hypothetical protein
VALGIALFAVSVVAPARASQELSPFTLVRRVGEPHLRYLHLFSTSAGKYTIRHDGFGEVYVGNRKKNFHLKTDGRAKIEWVYFYEYEGDLLLFYRTAGSGYFVRLDQKTRKTIRVEAVNHSFSPPVIRDKSAVFDDGTVVPLI